MARFGEVVTAMVTPFTDSGALDLDAAASLARWLGEHGSDGLVVAGTTGEGPVLTDAEKRDLWRAVAEAVTSPVVAGTGTNDTAHSVELTRQAKEAGVAGALVVTPYYNRPSQTGITGHFRAVAAASDLPILIYDIPIRTGRKIANETMLSLAGEQPTIVGVKDAALDVAGSARLIAEAPDGFEVYSGNDDQTLPLLAVGAVGVISVASHWAGPQISAMVDAFNRGDVVKAREIHTGLLPSWTFQGSEAAPNPIPAKAVMRVLGHRVGHCRPPNDDGPADLEARAQELLRSLR
jgi:4-hydroxy-tetrahydrodipicolinate synthase